MLFNCDNADSQHKRLCPCIINETNKQLQIENRNKETEDKNKYWFSIWGYWKIVYMLWA